jgi:hypothetical protein
MEHRAQQTLVAAVAVEVKATVVLAVAVSLFSVTSQQTQMQKVYQ